MRSTLELLSAAYTVHPGFAEARIDEIATQVRPTLPDNLPCITLHGPRQISLNGLYRHGFLIAPAMLDAAPGRFSTTNVWPSWTESRSATKRAVVSVALAAVKGTTTRSGLLGQFCAELSRP